MLEMWANRYIELSLASSSKDAKLWAKQYVPADATKDVKKLIEQRLGM